MHYDDDYERAYRALHGDEEWAAHTADLEARRREADCVDDDGCDDCAARPGRAALQLSGWMRVCAPCARLHAAMNADDEG